jgi:hypothetical protein
MTGEAAEFEDLLRRALTPIEPPEDLAERLEVTLVSLTEMAADELEAWELSAMKDPRNWVRPVAAAVVGTTAGAALVVIRARQREAHRRAAGHGIRGVARRTVRDVADEARKLLDR